jgi:ubiquinone/menaquinone biosynthesis C-methylase UbiE
MDALGVKATDAVLDFGCGPGFHTIPFAKIAQDVVAVDIQPKMLQKVSKYAEKNSVKVRTIQSNGRSIPLPDGSFNLIFLSGVYHELAEKTIVLTELKRLLKPRGKIIIRERTETGHFAFGPPAIDPIEVSEALRDAGYLVLAPTIDPSDKRATLIMATAK